MAVAAYSTNLTLLDDCNTDTGYAEPTASGWTSLNAESFSETDAFIQNANSISASVKVGVGATLFDNTTGITLGTNDAVLVWVYYTTPNSLDTESNGGIRQIIGASQADFDYVVHGGSDSYVYGGWINLAMGSPAQITTTSVGSGTGTTYRWHGWAFKALSVPSKGNPYFVDAMRYGRCDIVASAGDSGTPANFTDMAAKNDANDGTAGYNRWGLFQATPSGYLWKGLMSLGISGGAAVYFEDSNAVISIDNTKNVTAAFNAVEINVASSTVKWSNVAMSALGTTSRGTFTVVDNATVLLDGCAFTDMGDFTFTSGTNPNDIFDTTFRRCGSITAAGADFNGSQVLEPNVSANTSGLIWDVATDPDGLLDNMTFTKTSGTAHHAIEFGTTIPSGANYTLRGCAFGTDFSNSKPGTTGDETFHFKDTTGTITLNLVGCTGNFGYRTEGVTVTLVEDPVTTAITITDTASPPVAISGARVFIETSSGTGPLPFEESVSITQSGGTATVAHTGHGLSTDQYVVIRGASPNDYNKVAQITVTGVDAYTYAVNSGASSPATGSPVSSAVIISALSSGAGLVSDTRTFSSNQPFKGWARKSSGSPYYQNGAITGTISSTDGFTASIALLSDE